MRKYLINNFLDKFLQMSDINENDKICDLGCGEGFVIQKLIETNKNLVISGYDISEQALNIAKENFPEVDFELINLTNIPSKIGTQHFDKLLLMEVLEHIDEYDKVLTSISKLDFEKFIISVPNEPYFSLGNFMFGKNVKDLGKDPEHVNFWSPKEFRKLLENYFIVEQFALPFPWQIAVCRKKANSI